MLVGGVSTDHKRLDWKVRIRQPNTCGIVRALIALIVASPIHSKDLKAGSEMGTEIEGGVGG